MRNEASFDSDFHFFIISCRLFAMDRRFFYGDFKMIYTANREIVLPDGSIVPEGKEFKLNVNPALLGIENFVSPVAAKAKASDGDKTEKTAKTNKAKA